MYESITYVAEV